jgi:hypothetical protein
VKNKETRSGGGRVGRDICSRFGDARVQTHAPPTDKTGQAKTMCALPALGSGGDLDLIGQMKKKQDLEGRDLLEIMDYGKRSQRLSDHKCGQ